MGIEQEKKSPAAWGFYWPAEWEPQRALWLVWPHNRETWPGKFNRILQPYATFVRHVANYEPVELICTERDQELSRNLVGSTPFPIRHHNIATNDSWIRDYGPTYLRRAPARDGLGPNSISPLDATVAGIDWSYNAWGGKYPPYDLDQAVARNILTRCRIPRFDGPLTMEGGAIDGNGRGWIMTTRSSILNTTRNPKLSRMEAEAVFSNMLNTTECIWLPGEGLAGDDTDGHIDQLARFVGNTRVVVAVASDTNDENHPSLLANQRLLEQWRSRDGKALEVAPLPTPRRRWCQGRRLPCSYCNFVFVNGAVIVPQFEDPADDQAVAILRDCLPEHDIVPSPALDLVWGLGAFHCLSQQEVAGKTGNPSL